MNANIQPPGQEEEGRQGAPPVRTAFPVPAQRMTFSRAALTGAVLLAAALCTAACGNGSGATQASETQAAAPPLAQTAAPLHGMAAVVAVYNTVGYTPPAPSTIQDQSEGVCENLATGMSRETAAQAFSTGFTADINQARPVVNAIADNMCSTQPAGSVPAAATQIDEQTLAQQEAELGFSVTTHGDLPYDPTATTNADNIALGRAICQGMAGGQTASQELANLLKNQFTYVNAAHYMHMTVQYFCPAFSSGLSF